MLYFYVFMITTISNWA